MRFLRRYKYLSFLHPVCNMQLLGASHLSFRESSLDWNLPFNLRVSRMVCSITLSLDLESHDSIVVVMGQLGIKDGIVSSNENP